MSSFTTKPFVTEGKANYCTIMSFFAIIFLVGYFFTVCSVSSSV